MFRLRRRFALVAGAVVFSAGIARVAIDWSWREPPNYSRIEPVLWLGGFVPRPPPGTHTVLNLCESPDPYTAATYRWEPIRDTAPAPAPSWLRAQVEFLERERDAGKTVFVHCRNGVSRSGLVTAAYLMRKHHWSRDRALAFLRTRRPVVRPNSAFLELLSEWERSDPGRREGCGNLPACSGAAQDVRFRGVFRRLAGRLAPYRL